MSTGGVDVDVSQVPRQRDLSSRQLALGRMVRIVLADFQFSRQSQYVLKT